MKYIITCFVFCFSFVIYANFALKVDNSLTEQDIIAIKSLDNIHKNVEENCKNVIGNFDAELACLIAIQGSVKSIVHYTKFRCLPFPKDNIIEPAEYILRDYGCCYDRARFLEKAARYYGFKTRHVFLIQPKYELSLTNFLPLSQGSHATSEVLTVKGWLGIDSNYSFQLLDADNNPASFVTVLNNINDYPSLKPMDFYKKKPDVIYGLYSRHGNFHGKNFPGPEFVFSELLYNF